MPSLAKTLPRWYWTVRVLMNSRAPICGLDRPSRASRATWASWPVSSTVISTVRLRAVSPVASSSRGGPPGDRPDALRVDHLGRGARLPPPLAAAALAAQPLPVQQVAAGQLGPDPGPAQPLDRLPVAAPGGLALAEP